MYKRQLALGALKISYFYHKLQRIWTMTFLVSCATHIHHLRWLCAVQTCWKGHKVWKRWTALLTFTEKWPGCSFRHEGDTFICCKGIEKECRCLGTVDTCHAALECSQRKAVYYLSSTVLKLLWFALLLQGLIHWFSFASNERVL